MAELREDVTASELEALQSLVAKVAPLIIDEEETVTIDQLLKRVNDFDKFITLHNLVDGHTILAKLLLGYYTNHPQIFDVVEPSPPTTFVIRAAVRVKDAVAFRILRHLLNTGELNLIDYFKDKNDYYVTRILSWISDAENLVGRIDSAFEGQPQLKYMARLLALKRISPRWIFGYEYQKSLDELNSSLTSQRLMFEPEGREWVKLVETPLAKRKGWLENLKFW